MPKFHNKALAIMAIISDEEVENNRRHRRTRVREMLMKRKQFGGYLIHYSMI